MIGRRDERERLCEPTTVSRPADAMHPLLGGERQVVVHHGPRGWDVQAARRDVRRDEHRVRALGELLQRPHPLVLALVPVDEAHRDAVVPERGVDPARPASGPAEDDHASPLLLDHQMQQKRHLEDVVDLEHIVADVRGDPGVPSDLDPLGFRRKVRARLSIAGGIVALKNAICRSSGMRSRIVLICGRNPMSSIRSPSSITRCRMNARLSTSMSMSSRKSTRGADHDVDAGFDPLPLRLERPPCPRPP